MSRAGFGLPALPTLRDAAEISKLPDDSWVRAGSINAFAGIGQVRPTLAEELANRQPLAEQLRDAAEQLERRRREALARPYPVAPPMPVHPDDYARWKAILDDLEKGKP